ncbi:MAG: CsgE family curli-type amyloid fiber assembly protein [Paludibacter sp.]|nr:CsgE family curli-type amyloid fiber assembly protein [Paludibacter sp.]
MKLFVSIIILISISSFTHSQNHSIKTKSIEKDTKVYEIEKVIQEVETIEDIKLNFPLDGKTFQSIGVVLGSGIHFPLNESTLNDESKDKLEKLAQILKKNSSIRISILGHTDNTGSLEFNQVLSERRAQVVADFLVFNKVGPEQIVEVAGKNFSEPLASNDTEEGRAINRHAAVYIMLSDEDKKRLHIYGEDKYTLATDSTPESLKKIYDNILNKVDKQSIDYEIEIDGLLVDDTKTKTGKDFYDMFYSGWESPQNARNYTIIISEKPFRLTTTLILIYINDNEVYQSILQPRLDLLEDMSADAIHTTYDYLYNYDAIMKLINGEDMTGTGIY